MTRLGYFWNVSVTNFLSKVAQIFSDFFLGGGIFEHHHQLSIKSSVASFLPTFWNFGQLFIPSSGHTASNPNFYIFAHLTTSLNLVFIPSKIGGGGIRLSLKCQFSDFWKSFSIFHFYRCKKSDLTFKPCACVTAIVGRRKKDVRSERNTIDQWPML